MAATASQYRGAGYALAEGGQTARAAVQRWITSDAAGPNVREL